MNQEIQEKLSLLHQEVLDVKDCLLKQEGYTREIQREVKKLDTILRNLKYHLRQA